MIAPIALTSRLTVLLLVGTVFAFVPVFGLTPLSYFAKPALAHGDGAGGGGGGGGGEAVTTVAPALSTVVTTATPEAAMAEMM
jgi:hypothetical protein